MFKLILCRLAFFIFAEQNYKVILHNFNIFLNNLTNVNNFVFLSY